MNPGTRAALGGVAILWGVAGLYLTEPVGNTLGIEASKEEREKLERAIPSIRMVDRNKLEDQHDQDGFSDSKK
jgi:hypothetical protein